MKPKVIITIDTEIGEKAKFTKKGFENFVMGEIGDQYYGVPEITRVLNFYNFKAEFFVDVYESKYYGDDKYLNLCKYLDEKGHGVELHTHPSYAYDIARVNMHQYSLEEQIQIVSDGKNMIKKWIGKYPVAHRAGGYGANNDTLTALRVNDIEIDSSFLYNHVNCKIKLKTINNPILSNNVLEIPVTVIKKSFSMHPFIPPFQSRWLKLDVNGLTLKDLKKAINKLESEFVIIFLHSSSFILRDKTSLNIKGINHSEINKFEQLLKYLCENSFEIVKLSDIKDLVS